MSIKDYLLLFIAIPLLPAILLLWLIFGCTQEEARDRFRKYRKYVVIPILFLFLFSVKPAFAWSEDFTNLSNWTTINGTLNVTSNYVYASSVLGTAYYNNSNTNSSNYIVTFSYRAQSNNQSCGITLNGDTNFSNYYRIQIYNLSPSQYLGIFRYDSGVEHQVGSWISYSYNENWNDYTVEFDNGSWSLYQTGQTEHNFSDSTYTSGYQGVYSGATNCDLKNIIFTDNSSTPTPTPTPKIAASPASSTVTVGTPFRPLRNSGTKNNVKL